MVDIRPEAQQLQTRLIDAVTDGEKEGIRYTLQEIILASSVLIANAIVMAQKDDEEIKASIRYATSQIQGGVRLFRATNAHADSLN
jgi:hypothetical protein